MFKLFSKSRPVASFPFYQEIGTDMHSHLIPGIDDGSPDMETSVMLAKGMAELGYTKLVTTPHIMWDMYKNKEEVITAKLALLREALKDAGCNIEIYAAAEYFLDDHVANLLKENKPLLTISGNKVLVEFSLAYPSNSLKDILFDMQMQGYQPVIAHAERYTYLQQHKEYYDELRTIGCWFQLNILSLTGHYGKTVTELANWLIKKNYIELLGTDLHHQGHLEALKNPALGPPLRKLLDSGRIQNPQL
jgi:protein-tyrosine phosphatase